ncbi:MAG TPA: hypothetical protein VGS07_20630 [Thermoanaerobaculia bacterium]|jgi:hypothetical protein|nr:hypothetical protein [Thermoanaerobaculia bacterium]
MFRTVPYCLINGLLITVLCAGVSFAGETGAVGGVDLPVITAENMFQGGQTLSLNGLHTLQAAETDLAFVNLSQASNRCTLGLFTSDGAEFAPKMVLTLKPLEHRPFANIFEGRADEASGSLDVHASVSCEKAFYSYALLNDGAGRRFDVINPVQEVNDPLAAADTTVPECPAHATCFDAPGIVHVPAPPPGSPWGRVAFPAPPGVSSRFRLTMDVTVADWYKPEPNGKHLIYWFVISKNIDMPGLLYFLGPNTNQAFARHGVGLKHPQKLKIRKPFAAQIGHTYHIDNDYDMAGHHYTITITDTTTGKLAVVLSGRPNVSKYTIKPRNNFLVDMGFFPNKVPTEVPSYGWKYANVHVETYK